MLLILGIVFILGGMVFVFTFGTFCVCTVDRKCTLVALFVLLAVIAGQVFVMVSSSELKSTGSDDRYTEYWDSLSNDKRVSFQRKVRLFFVSSLLFPPTHLSMRLFPSFLSPCICF